MASNVGRIKVVTMTLEFFDDNISEEVCSPREEKNLNTNFRSFYTVTSCSMGHPMRTRGKHFRERKREGARL